MEKNAKSWPILAKTLRRKEKYRGRPSPVRGVMRDAEKFRFVLPLLVSFMTIMRQRDRVAKVMD